jgi:hypothetical protein
LGHFVATKKLAGRVAAATTEVVSLIGASRLVRLAATLAASMLGSGRSPRKLFSSVLVKPSNRG